MDYMHQFHETNSEETDSPKERIITPVKSGLAL